MNLIQVKALTKKLSIFYKIKNRHLAWSKIESNSQEKKHSRKELIMNFKSIFLTFSLAIFCLPAHGMVEFIAHAAVKTTLGSMASRICSTKSPARLPDDVRAQLQAQDSAIKKFSEDKDFRSDVNFDIIPGWVIKRRPQERTDGAKTLARLIVQHKFNHFSLTKPYAINHELTIEKVIQIPKTPEKITLQQTQQLYQLAQYAYWIDCHVYNFVKTSSNHVVIFDTEIASEHRQFTPVALKTEILGQMLSRFYKPEEILDEDSIDFLKKEYEKVLKEQPKKK